MKKRMVNLMGEYLAAGLYDVTGNEKWLADQARDGWLATEMNRKGRVEFVDSAPNATVRYRLRPTQKREKCPSAEEMELNEAFGWRYLGTAGKCLHLWRCDDPAAPELDTDPEVQAESFRYLMRRSVWECVLGVGTEILFGLALIWLLGTGSLVDMIWKGRLGYITLIAAYVILAPIAMGLEAITLIRQVRWMRAGIYPGETRIRYRTKRCFRGLLHAILVAMLLYVNFPGGYEQVPAEGAVYPSIYALEGTPGDEQDAVHTARTKRLELAPRVWIIRQFGQNGAQMETEYYRMLTEPLAKRMETDLVEKCEWEKSNETEMIRLESEELDGFWWMRCPDGPQYAVARLGNCVMRVHYYRGEANLRDHADLFAATLKTK